jgi:hypothetical protein
MGHRDGGMQLTASRARSVVFEKCSAALAAAKRQSVGRLSSRPASVRNHIYIWSESFKQALEGHAHHMPRSAPAQAIQHLLQMSRITAPLCLIGLFLSCWLGPHSVLFIIAAIIASLLYTTFWLLYWYYRAEDAGAMIFWLLTALAIGPGYVLARNIVFGRVNGTTELWLGVQFATTFLLVFTGIVLLFRMRIRRAIAPADETSSRD